MKPMLLAYALVVLWNGWVLGWPGAVLMALGLPAAYEAGCWWGRRR